MDSLSSLMDVCEPLVGEIEAFVKGADVLASQVAEYNATVARQLTEQRELQTALEERKKQEKLLRMALKDETSLNLPRKDELTRKLNTTVPTPVLPAPGNWFVRMFLGNMNIVMLGQEERLSFKSNYELSKQSRTKRFIAFQLITLALNNSAVDVAYHCVLFLYFVSQALRENILKANGSRINRWWMWHHYVSIILSLLIMTWQGPEKQEFRILYFGFALYMDLLQILQTRYQMGRLYAMRALGKAGPMDTVNADTTQIHRAPGMWTLLPFIVVAQVWQFSLGVILLCFVWRRYQAHDEWHWQSVPIGLLFVVLSVGNVWATWLAIFGKKWKRKTQ